MGGKVRQEPFTPLEECADDMVAFFKGLFYVVAIGVAAFALAVLASRVSHARDNEEWETTPPEVRQWYRGLMRPDYPSASCCGEADAYYADKITVEIDGNGEPHVYATITDERDIPGRPNIPAGSRVEIPPEKYKFDSGNPTGHNVLFVRLWDDGSFGVFCFVQGAGI